MEGELAADGPAGETGERAAAEEERAAEEFANQAGARAAEESVAGAGERRAEEHAAEVEERAAEEPTSHAEESAASPTGEGLEGEPTAEEAEPSDQAAPAAGRIKRHAVRKVFAGPLYQLRRAPRFSAMEDARKAEGLLERLRLPEFQDQIHRQTTAGLLDGIYASLVQVANEVLGVRDSILHSANRKAQNLDRIFKLEKRCQELGEEFKKEREAAGQELAAMEADRDAWRERGREAECRTEIETSRLRDVEADLMLARQEAKELSGRLSIAEGRVGQVESRAQAAEERAEAACKKAEGAERRATQADELNGELSRAIKEVAEKVAHAEVEARKASAAQLLAAAQIWDAEAHLEKAESWA